MFFSACTLESTITKVNEPADGAEHNPPQWPNSVTIIESSFSDEKAQEILNTVQEESSKVVITEDMLDMADPGCPKFLLGTEQFTPTEHFSKERKAVFFEPRAEPYKVDFQVGYYVQAAGLGASAADVKFADDDGSSKKGIYCPAYFNSKEKNILALDTFWRSAENFTNETKDGLLWAVSQAAPIRRVHAAGNLLLHDKGGKASGGHIANAQVDGNLVFGSQQQFCSRSITVGDQGGINLGAWSNVFVDTKAPKGCLIAPDGWNFPENLSLETRPDNWWANWGDGKVYKDGKGPSTTVNVPDVTVEKCFVAMKNDGSEKRYFLHVPKPRIRTGGVPLGADLSGSSDETRDFEQVYVAKATLDNEGYNIDVDVACKINKAFRQGKDVVLSPGTYHLKEPIRVIKDNQVLLGVGMATLTAPTSGEPCIRVAPRTEGVRIGGIMFASSRIKKRFFFPPKTTSFIEFGKEGVTDLGNRENPGVLTDLFCRVGGDIDREVSTDVMVRIHSGNVLGDNLWLWRADHVELADGELPNYPDKGLDYHQVVLGECPGKTGLEVNGDNVVIHGLAVEHTTEDQVVWNGNNGEVFFYQCELPYDVDQGFGVKNYSGFRVNGKNHTLGGAGVYSNFRDFNVCAKTAIVHPNAFDAKKVINPFTVHLDNIGRIMTVVSDGVKLGGGPTYATSDGALSKAKYLPPQEVPETTEHDESIQADLDQPVQPELEVNEKLASLRSNSPDEVAGQ